MSKQEYILMRPDDVVQYMPTRVDAILGQGGPSVRAVLMDRGLELGVDYVVKEASEPRTQGNVTAQTITIMVDGKPLAISSSFLTVVAQAPR